MKKLLVSFAAVFAVAAFANGTPYVPPTTPSTPGTQITQPITNTTNTHTAANAAALAGAQAGAVADANQRQRQQQATQVGVGQQTTNRGEVNGQVTGGAQAQQTETAANVDGSGNSNSHVDASNRGVDNSQYDGRALFVHRVTPDTPPAIVAQGAMMQIVDPTCGPLQGIKETDIYGTESGWFWDSKVFLGTHQEPAMFRGEDGKPMFFMEVVSQGQTMLVGHKKAVIAAVLTVASGKSAGIGGNNSSLAGGQVGFGNTGAMQRLVQQQNYTFCIYALPQQPRVEVPVVGTLPTVKVLAPRQDRN